MAKAKVKGGQLSLSPVMERYMAAAADIQQAPDQTEKAFLARELVSCTLPHRNPGNVPVWRRRNGDFTLSIQPLVGDDDAARYPYGVLPRLVLFWICTEAVRTKSRRLTFGKSFSEFMRELGLNPSNGGKRSDSVRLHDQLDRLMGARIALRQPRAYEGAQGVSNAFMEISSANDLWWGGRPKQDTLFESWVELGEKFFNAITAAPVPLDLRALRGLRNSSLGLDLYSLISYRTYMANKRGAPQMIPWKGLHEQIGAEYAQLRQFRAKVRKLLPTIMAVYPNMKVSTVAGHLVISPAPTSIASRPRRIPLGK